MSAQLRGLQVPAPYAVGQRGPVPGLPRLGASDTVLWPWSPHMRDKSLPRLAPDALFHRCYRVIRCLKAGGMGAVYEVVDERTDARRALKVMLPDLVGDPDLRARFAREAWITGNIESEHIVRTVDAGVDEDTLTPFIAMELLRGEDLGSLLAKRKTLPPYEVVHYLFQIARALDRTHAAGIVHLDLKPENLFLTRRDDGSPCVKVLDFGISQVVEQSGRGRTTRCIGTPLYMPPQAVSRRSAIDPRTDLYALGHSTFSLLVGAPYWEKEWRESETQFAFLTKVARGVREPASARARFRGVALSTAFDAWFLKATSVPLDERFDSAGEAIERLAGVLDVPLPKPSLAEIEPAEDTTGSTGSVTASGSTRLAGESTEPMVSERVGGATWPAMRSARIATEPGPAECR